MLGGGTEAEEKGDPPHTPLPLLALLLKPNPSCFNLKSLLDSTVSGVVSPNPRVHALVSWLFVFRRGELHAVSWFPQLDRVNLKHTAADLALWLKDIPELQEYAASCCFPHDIIGPVRRRAVQVCRFMSVRPCSLPL